MPNLTEHERNELRAALSALVDQLLINNFHDEHNNHIQDYFVFNQALTALHQIPYHANPIDPNEWRGCCC